MVPGLWRLEPVEMLLSASCLKGHYEITIIVACLRAPSSISHCLGVVTVSLVTDVTSLFMNLVLGLFQSCCWPSEPIAAGWQQRL